jgi:hypothetical protein
MTTSRERKIQADMAATAAAAKKPAARKPTIAAVPDPAPAAPAATARKRETVGRALAKRHPAVPVTDEMIDAVIAGVEPTEPVKAEPVKAERVLTAACTDCGYKFPKPRARATCNSAAACQRRQDKAASAAKAATAS